VDALDGAPGVISARYAGEKATDTERVDFLLDKIKDVPKEKRGGRYYCVIALAQPNGKVQYSTGECKGVIAFEPCGKNGFGYDPIFCFPKYGKTMAELPVEIKNRVSHRGRAAQKARLLLEKMA
jgi:XTP/dITP diphosphohydrolase